MQPVVAAIALAAAASACPLHDLADALEAGRIAAGPHDWPYAAACAAYSNTTEATWCGPGVRNSSGLSLHVHTSHVSSDDCASATPSRRVIRNNLSLQTLTLGGQQPHRREDPGRGHAPRREPGPHIFQITFNLRGRRLVRMHQSVLEEHLGEELQA
jgi:hypothetical protein